MKGINLFCKTPASTAICNSTGQKSIVRHGIRDLDHQAPHLSDQQWIKPPSPSQPPSKTNCHYHQKSRKSSITLPDLTTPPGSSRYLSNHSAIYDHDVLPSDFSSLPAFLPVDSMKGDESPAFKSSPPATTNEQVVVLKVSLHCKGCEGKVKKHISRMEGVRSFGIDFPKKKVTVIGDVTPLGVLVSHPGPESPWPRVIPEVKHTYSRVIVPVARQIQAHEGEDYSTRESNSLVTIHQQFI